MSGERRVRRLIPSPSSASAMKLKTSDATSAVVPEVSRKGRSGTKAPAVKAAKDPTRCRERRSDASLVEPDFLEDQLSRGMVAVLEDRVDERGRLFRREPAVEVEPFEDPSFLLGDLAQLLALERDLVVEQLALTLHRDVLAHAHAERARDQARDASEDDDGRLRACAGNAHHQREVRDEAVVGPEDDRAQDGVERCLVGRRRVGERVLPDGAGRSGGHRRHRPTR